MRGMLRASAAAAITLATVVAAAPPYSAALQPVGPATIRSAAGALSAKDLKVAPGLLDLFVMSFDFRHAKILPDDKGVSLPIPGPPTATKQGIVFTLFSYGIYFTPDKNSILHLVFSSTNKPSTADFRSDAFEIAARKTLDLFWEGAFETDVAPIQLRLLLPGGGEIGAVTFRDGHVYTGDGSGTPFGAYAGQAQPKMLHQVQLHADLVKRSYTVRFEENGTTSTSAEVPFPAAAGPIPAGMQQVTARLTSPKLYGLFYYDLARTSLSGEKG